MTASPISRMAIALVVTMLWPVSFGWAQSDSNEPLFIIPFDGFDDDDASAGQPLPQNSVAPEVEIETLTAPSGGAAGLIDPSKGGLPSDMWRDGDPVIALTLLPEIPAATNSAAMNRLARRMLLSIAEPPRDVDQAQFLGFRLERLVALGAGGEIEELLSGTGDLALAPAVMRPRVDQMFLAGDVLTACPLVREMVRTDPEAYWQKALIFCQRLDGQHAQADLGLSLLGDQGVDVGPDFLLLDRALGGEPGISLPSLAGVDPLVLAMALQADVTIAPDAVEGGEPAVLGALAKDQNTALETRLAAGEVAVAQAVLEVDTLRNLYGEVTFGADERASALTTAQKIGGAKGRALLYQAALAQPSDTARAEVFRALLLNAAGQGVVGYAAMARVLAPEFTKFQMTPEIGWFSADAVAALLIAGEPQEAARWWPLMEDRGRVDAAAKDRIDALWPMMRMAFGEQLTDDGQRMMAWWRQFDAEEEVERRSRGRVYVALMTGLDDAAIDPLLPELIAGPQLPSDAAPLSVLIDTMSRSAGAERVGQTVLVALVSLGENGTFDSDPMTLGAVVAALRQIGLGQDARLIALEAAFAGGA